MKTFILLISFAFFTSSVEGQWIASNNGLTNLNVRALLSDGQNIFTGTEGGGIFLSTNNGANWTAVNTGLTDLNITSLVIKGSDIFAGTHSGIFHSSNNGAGWALSSNGLGNLNVDALATNGTDLFAGTYSGGIWTSSNNGLNWSAINNGLPTSPLPSVNELAVNGTDLFAGDGSMSGTCGIYYSSNNGSNWTILDSGMTSTCVQSLLITGSHIFSGNMYDVYYSANNGISWTPTNSAFPAFSYVPALAANGNSVFAGISSGGVFLTLNNGVFWTDVSTGLPAAYVAALMVKDNDIYAGVGGMGGNGIFKRPLSDFPTGMEEYSGNEALVTFAPNPFHTKTTLNFQQAVSNTTILLFDTQGKEVRSLSCPDITCDIERDNLQAGIYFVQIVRDNGLFHTKLVIE